MAYKYLTIPVHEAYHELLVAELSLLGFDSFEEKENELIAYIPSEAWDENSFHEVQEKYASQFEIPYTLSDLEDKNWNELWESNFEPIVVKDTCYIRATFHAPQPQYPMEVVINPQMSFGTGHHETTSLMLEFLIEMDLQGKTLLDLGTGTGILAIFAQKYGATTCVGTDIDPWSIANAVENQTLNPGVQFPVLQGTINELIPQLTTYDIVLANINRNILTAELPLYAQCLKPKAPLLLSGFYQKDVEILAQVFEPLGFKIIEKKTKNEWTALKLIQNPQEI